jgi:hypothetical protein
VRFIADDQVPFGLRELRSCVVITRELVQPRYHQRHFGENVATSRRFKSIVSQNVKGQLEPLVELVLPLLDQIAWAHNKTPANVSTDHQLLDEKTGHNSLAGAGIVGEDETKWLPHKQLAIYGCDLMRKRFDKRGMNREMRIEQMGESDASCLGDKSKQARIPGERPARTRLNDFQHWLAISEDEFVPNPPGGIFVRKLNDVRPMPDDVNEEYVNARDQSTQTRIALDFLKSCHTTLQFRTS